MSNNESFIDEVTDEVRRDRLFAWMRRWGWLAVLLVLAIVAGAAWTEWQRMQNRAQARDLGDQLMQAMALPSAAERQAAVIKIAAPGVGPESLRDFLEAASAIEAGDTVQALAAWDRIAARADLAETYRHLALLKRVLAAGPDMEAAARGQALATLAAPGAPYRLLALEQQALDLVSAGDHGGAIAALNALLIEDGVTPGLRRRASQLIVALGGSVSSA